MLTIMGAFFIRGGLQRKPLSVSHAFVFSNRDHSFLALNSFFTFIRSSAAANIKKLTFFSSNKKAKDILSYPNKTSQRLEEFKKIVFPQSNVIVVILESFSTSYMRQGSSQAISYTPFLDTLASKAIFYKYHFANGRKSMEALYSIFAATPNLIDMSLVSSPYHGVQMQGLASVL